MEFIDGETVEDLVVRRGPLPPAEALGLAAQVARALGAAAKQGLVHRDIKPANLMVVREDDEEAADRQGDRLRPRAPGGGRGRHGADHALRLRRHAAVRQPRADRGARPGHPLGHLFAGGHALVHAHRPADVLRSARADRRAAPQRRAAVGGGRAPARAAPRPARAHPAEKSGRPAARPRRPPARDRRVPTRHGSRRSGGGGDRRSPRAAAVARGNDADAAGRHRRGRDRGRQHAGGRPARPAAGRRGAARRAFPTAGGRRRGGARDRLFAQPTHGTGTGWRPSRSCGPTWGWAGWSSIISRET